MTGLAQGSRSQLLIKSQPAFGTAASGNFNRLRFNMHSLDVVKQTVESPELRSDREVVDFRHSSQNAAGDVAVALIYGDHDLLLESAMFGTFGTDSVSIGTTPQYLSIEDGQTDIGLYQMYDSLLVNKMDVSIQPNQLVTATFNLIGRTGTAPAGASSGGTPVAASTNQPFAAFDAAIYDDVAESGSEIDVVTGLTFSVDNSVAPTPAVGTTASLDLQYGRGRVTGQFTAYYNNSAWVDRFLAETEVALAVNITDPDSNTFEFLFPRIKVNNAAKPVQNEQARIITLPFVALYESNVGSAFQITKL